MTLNELKVGESAVITAVGGEGALVHEPAHALAPTGSGSTHIAIAAASVSR